MADAESVNRDLDIQVPDYKIDDVIQGARGASVTIEAEDPQPATDSTGEGIRVIPAVIRLEQPAIVAEARDALLRAIGREADHVADKFPGQASKALEELARAFALVTVDTAAVGAAAPSLSARGGEARHSINLTASVNAEDFYAVPIDADLVTGTRT
ncbi:hypothetical protein [Streptomyces xanthochromogenes]|uniref:hypothetical protein n=1 Tax=Streptomyces xanthochromogenes TaxID=67384 RepID=UPI003440DFE1